MGLSGYTVDGVLVPAGDVAEVVEVLVDFVHSVKLSLTQITLFAV